MAGGKTQLKPIDIMGGPLKDGPDNGGGYMGGGDSNPKVKAAAGESIGGQKGPIDIKGGPLLEGPDNPGGFIGGGSLAGVKRGMGR